VTVGLFIPCYVDQFYPEIGKATLSILQKLGYKVDYPLAQTCCGQPMANSGFENKSEKSVQHFKNVFGGFEYVVAPSASCVLFIQEQVHGRDGPKLFELSDFLVNHHKDELAFSSYHKKVGIHTSCHGLRGLRLGKSSELVGEEYSYLRSILEKIPDLELVSLDRQDECCGFGGTFSVVEEAVSVRMGQDRLADHDKNGSELITGTDMSCLMHLSGLAKRKNDNREIVHFSEILDQVLS